MANGSFRIKMREKKSSWSHCMVWRNSVGYECKKHLHLIYRSRLMDKGKRAGFETKIKNKEQRINSVMWKSPQLQEEHQNWVTKIRLD